MKFLCSFAGASRSLRLLLLFAGPISLQAGSALSFDGVNDYVTFGSAPALNASAFTIETWFKRQGNGVSTSTPVSVIATMSQCRIPP